MSHTHRKALATGLATALTLAAVATPAAHAQPTDRHSPNPRDAAQPAHVVVAGPSSGLDWGSAGIGAAAGLGACGIALVGAGGLRRRVRRPAAEL
jgi:hypothetical protein